MQAGNRRAILAALFANAGLAVAKFVGFAFTGAASMLAEGVHSVADSANQALLLWGGAAAKREATPRHPFGYGRERYFWAFVVALVIFALGAVFSISEGLDKLRHPHELSSVRWAVGILLLGIALESYSFHTAVTEARPLKRGASWWSFVRRSKNPELPVVLLEDLGALFGLVIALIGIGLAAFTGDARFDALGSVAIGLLLGAIAIVLAVEMKSLLIGEAATPQQNARIQAAMLDCEDVRRVIHMRTQHLGPEELLVAAKLDFDPRLSFSELAAAIDRVEERVRATVPIARVIYLEPDVYRAPAG